MKSESDTGRLVRLHVVGSLFEAQQIRALLDEANIDSSLVSYHDTAMDGLYQAQKGYGEIQVPVASEANARKILEENLEQLGQVTEEDLERQAIEAQPSDASESAGSGSRWGFVLLFLLVIVAGALVIYNLFADAG